MARNLRIASVVVDLVANSARYIASLRKANQDTRRYTRSMQRSFNHLSRNIAGMAAGYLGFAAVINQFNKTLANAKEIDIMAQLAGQSVEDFQAAAYASNQFGISAEKLGDISKDVQDKLGDFIATGGGEFKDFFEQVAPKVGLTADQLQGLSGPDVLLRVKKAMEDANVPMEQQVFYLEAIANDASKLIPLLENNGDAYHRLAQEARDANIIMSQADITALRESEKVINRVSSQLSTSFAKGVAGAAGQIEWLGKVISDAVEFWGTQFDSWTKNPRTLEGMIERGADLIEELDHVNASIALLEKNPGSYNGSARLAALNTQAIKLREEIKTLTEKRWELQAKEAEAEKKLQERLKNQPGAITGGNSSNVATTVKKTADELIKENQRLLDNLKRQLASQEKLIDLNAQRQIDMVYSMELTKDQITRAGFDNRLQMESHFLLQIEAERLAAHDRLEADVDETTKTTEKIIGSTTKKLADFIGEESDVMANIAENFAYNFSTSLANMVTTGKANFADLANSIINEILRISIQMKLVNPLLESMGILPTETIAGAAATGGPVMRGQTYLVGEKGPELFTASNSGNITPNHKLGGNTQVNIYTQPGETAETRTRQTEQGDIIEVFMKQVDSRMNEQISRGQGLARTLEGRYALSRKSY